MHKQGRLGSPAHGSFSPQVTHEAKLALQELDTQLHACLVCFPSSAVMLLSQRFCTSDVTMIIASVNSDECRSSPVDGEEGRKAAGSDLIDDVTRHGPSPNPEL